MREERIDQAIRVGHAGDGQQRHRFGVRGQTTHAGPAYRSQPEIILKTWEVSKGTYGLRFQQFFENRLLKRGQKSAGA